MNQKLILLPLLAQVLLTAIVFFRMYYTRVTEMRSKRIHPQKIASSASAMEHLIDSAKVADNFSNLLELPTLFYVLMIALYITSLADTAFLIMASVYVALRGVHSYIHCGSNNVLHRFYAYASSSFVLWAMWLLFTFDLIRVSF